MYVAFFYLKKVKSTYFWLDSCCHRPSKSCFHQSSKPFLWADQPSPLECPRRHPNLLCSCSFLEVPPRFLRVIWNITTSSLQWANLKDCQGQAMDNLSKIRKFAQTWQMVEHTEFLYEAIFNMFLWGHEWKCVHHPHKNLYDGLLIMPSGQNQHALLINSFCFIGHSQLLSKILAIASIIYFELFSTFTIMSHPNTASEYPGNIVSQKITRNSTSSNQEDLFNSDHPEPSTQTTNHGVEEGDNIFPSQYECPSNHEPPVVGATIMNHPQVFEYSAIFRHVANSGHLSVVCSVEYLSSYHSWFNSKNWSTQSGELLHTRSAINNYSRKEITLIEWKWSESNHWQWKGIVWNHNERTSAKVSTIL